MDGNAVSEGGTIKSNLTFSANRNVTLPMVISFEFNIIQYTLKFGLYHCGSNLPVSPLRIDDQQPAFAQQSREGWCL
jgi:hypothetical protein